MVSTNIKGMDLSDEELKHLMVEVCDMAMGMLSGGAVPSAPIHEYIPPTMMLELLPYDSGKSEFSEEVWGEFWRDLFDEENREKEPPAIGSGKGREREIPQTRVTRNVDTNVTGKCSVIFIV
tara:strand:- start:2544 stop:2909 length:366 start_codon:yes stop_codon:yes gene_type:complete